MIELHHRNYSIAEIRDLIASNEPLELSDQLIENIKQGRTFLESFIERADRPIYGINTGFGSLCDTEIASDDLGKLQENLVKSHACGLGSIVDPEIVKYMLVLKVLGLSKGNSGVKLQTVEGLLDLYNSGVIPVVYEQGSLGASGDLAPLAHLSLPLLGLGEVHYNGEIVPAREALAIEGLSVIELGAKEGLALLNGTQFMSAYSAYILGRLQKHMVHVDRVAA